jgi:hypothetical protein
MNKIFFFLYNFYYKDGNPYNKMDPIRQTSWVFAICITCWAVFFDNIFSYFFKYHIDIYTHGIVDASIGLICGGVIYSYYLESDRSIMIYRKYKSSLAIKKIKEGTIFSFIFIFLPFLLTITWFLTEHFILKSL